MFEFIENNGVEEFKNLLKKHFDKVNRQVNFNFISRKIKFKDEIMTLCLIIVVLIFRCSYEKFYLNIRDFTK